MTSKFCLKLKTKDKNIELCNNLKPDSSVADFLRKLSEAVEIPAANMKILTGYPRVQLNISEARSINELGIKCGDTLFVEEDHKVIKMNENILTSISESCSNNNLNIKINPDNSENSASSRHIIDDDERTGIKGILLKKDVPADNSCLFSSIEFVVSGKLDAGANSYMRDVVASIIASQPNEYNEAILGKPIEEYCKWIQNPNSWGGAIEIAILSEHLGFEIVVVNSISGNISRFGEDRQYPQRVFLLFDGIHYDPLYMDFMDINKIQTIFSTSDETILQDAEQLAKEAKTSKQYTDVNQFMICCKNCNSVFVGQVEAQKHAQQTGHASFDEVRN